MEDATFNLQTGQFTSPIRTKQGWLILEVAEHNKGGGIAALAMCRARFRNKSG